jgi:2-succinyl-5-enolpyruvyl-6-hydroxy-3-cyclohexene-1-carboxylate synthase
VSVPSTSAVQATFAATIVDEWVRHGLREVVLCPGSRSTPLALAVADRAELTLHVRIDERSAAFFAIGCALRSERPVAVVVTSGTAAAELHAAVAEADLAGVALLVVTADRPPELHGVGAPQTVRQREMFGPLVRRYEEPGVAREEARATWRPLAARLYAAAAGPGRGPVHLNAAFVEPLLAEPRELPAGRDGGEPWVRVGDQPVEPVPGGAARTLLVAGASTRAATLTSAHARGWVVLGDATARRTLAHFDAILRDDEVAAALRPDLVVRAGGLPASKVLQQRLREWAAPVEAVGTAVADPDGLVSGRASAPVVDVPADPGYLARWSEASQTVAELAAHLDDDALQLCEPSLARQLVETSGDREVPLFVGSSMPVRDVEWWAGSRRGLTLANRGANGIDGVCSSTLGAAAGGRALGLVGDVTFLHDVSALTDGLGEHAGACALVVADNGGGGIFSFLAQGEALEPDRFSRLFATPRGHDLVALARGFGHEACAVSTNGELREVVEVALSRAGLTVVVAKVPHYLENVTLHDELNRLAIEAVRERLL